MSAFLAIRDAAVAVLSAQPPLAAGFIHTGRAFPLPQERQEGIFVRLARGSGDAPFSSTTHVDWATDLVVQVLVRAQAGDDGETAVDRLLEKIYQRLAAAAPPPAAATWVLNPSVAFDVDEADQTLGMAELRLRINHRTADGSLSAAT